MRFDYEGWVQFFNEDEGGGGQRFTGCTYL